MPELPENNHHLQSAEALQAFQHILHSGPTLDRVAIDTEADSLHSFKEKLCLIQFSSGLHHAIIDPLAISPTTLDPFMASLQNAEVWMHGADFDITMLKRRFDQVPEKVMDTQIAARLCGAKQFGLANLVQDVFGVVLSKQSQRADWGKRPLLDKMVDYALNDVRYILPLADHYIANLKTLGRHEWFLESCADARTRVLDRIPRDKEDAWRIKGSGKLKPQGLCYLRAIWQWRNGEAERLNRPVFKVISNDSILAFAEQSVAGQQANLPERFPSSAARRFQKAIQDAAEVPQADWPKRRHGLRLPRNPDTEKQVEVLKQKRDAVALELDIDPSLIASRASLELIAAMPDQAEQELLHWQRTLLGF